MTKITIEIPLWSKFLGCVRFCSHTTYVNTSYSKWSIQWNCLGGAPRILLRPKMKIHCVSYNQNPSKMHPKWLLLWLSFVDLINEPHFGDSGQLRWLQLICWGLHKSETCFRDVGYSYETGGVRAHIAYLTVLCGKPGSTWKRPQQVDLHGLVECELIMTWTIRKCWGELA